MVTLKRLEKRMNVVEEWLKDFEKGAGPAQTMDNVNWLIAQCRTIGQQLADKAGHCQQLEMMHQQNGMALQTFIEEKDLVMDWQAHITKLQEEQNALQESKTEEVSVQEQAESSEETIEAPVEEES